MVGKTFAEVKVIYVERLPSRPIDHANSGDKRRHDRMVRLVTAMLDAKTHLAAAKTERDADYYRGKCDALDREIDSLVYDLYDLTAAEIALVESAS